MFIVVAFNVCGLPSIVLQYNIAQIFIMIALFSQFYMRNYGTDEKSSAGKRPTNLVWNVSDAGRWGSELEYWKD